MDRERQEGGTITIKPACVCCCKQIVLCVLFQMPAPFTITVTRTCDACYDFCDFRRVLLALHSVTCAQLSYLFVCFATAPLPLANTAQLSARLRLFLLNCVHLLVTNVLLP